MKLSDFNNIKVQGLMTIAPFVENPEENRYNILQTYENYLLTLQRKKLIMLT